jgi:DNA polymerase-3 subunit epsilon
LLVGVLQRSFDDLGPALSDVTFCVLDLETTGGSPHDCAITEVGAVKVCGGEPRGTFQTLVDPGCAIPPEITVLTGITQSMVMRAPRIGAVLPSLLEFVGDSVIVGHNVRFDVSFLNAALAHDERPKLSNAIVDTCALARRLLRDDVPNCKLDTLANRLRLDHRPSHRALDDALATTDLLHVLIERATGLGVTGLDDLLALPTLAGTAHVSKLRLTDQLPRAPGIYVFRDVRGEVLYVGKASNLRSRVRSYFSTDSRRKVGNLLRELARVDHTVCRGALEATVLELRLIQQHSPRYNRVGRRRAAPVFVRLTDERFPRLSTVRKPPAPNVAALGPLTPAHAALVIEAIETVVPLRRCSARPERNPRESPCPPAQLGVATCPCASAIDQATYRTLADRVERGLGPDPAVLLEPLAARMQTLAATERFEDAAATRDRADALASALSRRRRVDGLERAERMVFDIRGEGRVEVRRGCLVVGTDEAHPTLDLELPDDRSLIERFDEQHCIAGWLDRYAPRVNLVHCEGDYAEALPRIASFTPR